MKESEMTRTEVQTKLTTMGYEKVSATVWANTKLKGEIVTLGGTAANCTFVFDASGAKKAIRAERRSIRTRD
jgi:hypothetical protein